MGTDQPAREKQPGLDAGQMACAVADLLRRRDSNLVQHGQEEVRHRGLVGDREREVTTALERTAGAARDQARQVHVVVDVAVAQAAAVENHRVIEQRAVAVVRVAHSLQEVAEQLDVVLVDLGFPGDQLRVVDVMRAGVV